jgi:hypothetical protein
LRGTNKVQKLPISAVLSLLIEGIIDIRTVSLLHPISLKWFIRCRQLGYGNYQFATISTYHPGKELQNNTRNNKKNNIKTPIRIAYKRVR